MKEKWVTAAQILRYNWKALVGFELLYKLLAATVFAPLCALAVRCIVNVTGYAYLTVDNVGAFLRNPVSLFLLLLLLLLVVLYTVLDICAVLYAIDRGYHRRQVTVPQMFAAAAPAALGLLRPRNLPGALLALLLLPAFNFGVLFSYMGTVAVPETVADFLLARRKLAGLFVLLLILLVIFLMRRLYAFHYYLLEDCSWSQARRRSIALARNRRLGDLAALTLLQAAAALLFLLLSLALIAAAVFLSGLLLPDDLRDSGAAAAAWMVIHILFFLFTALLAPLTYCLVSALYYAHKRRRGESVLSPAPVPAGRWTGKMRRAQLILAAICVVCCCFYARRIMLGDANLSIEYLHVTEVTAHRGASRDYPENTMAAFRAAAELGADWIELDVQQTADGQLIVMHDTSLSRTTGVQKNVWDATWEEISRLDAGSWFSPDFAGEGVPLLSQVLEFAVEQGIRLNIELKPTGHETDFERQVVELVREYGYAEECVITSQVYSVLERAKEYDPEIHTVYVMSVAYGDLLRLEAADAFSVQAASLTAGMVSRLHDQGREVYAWTVNTRYSMDKMLRLNVDNLITDDIPLARERVFTNKTSDFIQDYIDWLWALAA